jgi:hypothetical protein
LRRQEFPSCFTLTYSGIVTSMRSRRPHGRPSPHMERSPTPHAPPQETRAAAVSAPSLSPDYFRRRLARPVSCYALFKRWLLLSQHPGCLSKSTSFSTEDGIGGLNWRSGLFPSCPWRLSPMGRLLQQPKRYSEFDWLWKPVRAPKPFSALPPFRSTLQG